MIPASEECLQEPLDSVKIFKHMQNGVKKNHRNTVKYNIPMILHRFCFSLIHKELFF